MSDLICGCNRQETNTPKSYVLCKKHWNMLPASAKRAVRPHFIAGEPEEGINDGQTLRAQPSPRWIVKVRAFLNRPGMSGSAVSA